VASILLAKLLLSKGTGNERCAKLGHSIFSKMKLRQQTSSTAIHITIVKIAEMIYLTRHLLTKTEVHQQVNSVKKAVLKQSDINSLA